MKLNQEIKLIFYKLINTEYSDSEELNLEEVENIILENLEEIKLFFSKIDYFEIIDFNYSQRDSKYELLKIVRNYIDYSEFETWRIKNYLNKIINKQGDILKILVEIYNDYCYGNKFLEIIALDYGLDLERLFHEENFQDNLYNNIFNCSIKLEELYKDLIEEANKLLEAIDKKEIIFKNIRVYEDYRKLKPIGNRKIERKFFDILKCK